MSVNSKNNTWLLTFPLYLFICLRTVYQRSKQSFREKKKERNFFLER